VQTLIRFQRPSTNIFFLCTFGRNSRFVLGALRRHAPECLWRMARPKVVRLSHTSHCPAAMSSVLLVGSQYPSAGADGILVCGLACEATRRRPVAGSRLPAGHLFRL